jgi:hypothetical protein
MFAADNAAGLIYGRADRGDPGPHGVDCGVDSGHFPAVFALKAAGQTARIVYVVRHLAGLEAETLAA